MNEVICPVCGSPMESDRRLGTEVYLCYTCGNVENRSIAKKNAGDKPVGSTNYEHLINLAPDGLTEFLSRASGIDAKTVANWLQSDFKG